MKKLSFALCFVLLAPCLFAQNVTPSKKQSAMVGKWAFERFEFAGELKNAPDDVVAKANKTNKGLVLTFTADYKSISEQKGGLKQNNTNTTYRLLKGDRFVIMGDTITVQTADTKQLRLYRNEDSPVAVFKRVE
ncbi:MAG: hypothetical protein JST68_12425 [Bacteroidetes bacterium]|nr:hypothetical protein [Bacteroidota bacterium]